MAVDIAEIRSLPKVALHDHLDGGLRPATIIDLAPGAGVELVSDDPAVLGDWFFTEADSGSLVRYLRNFALTCAVMQTRDNLVRIAREFVADQAADGVVYAEARWAPEQHVAGGLSLEQAVVAVRDGLAAGTDEAAATGHPIVVRQLLTAMRQNVPTLDVARLAVAYRGDSVAGFDLAGPEDGFPPARFAPVWAYLHGEHVPLTIHAGEAAGLASIREAVDVCGADRIGHGVRLIDDIDTSWPNPVPGRLASSVRDRRITLEVCPSSNLQTGIAARLADHPVDTLIRSGMRVAISCDNRLMSRTSLSREFALLAGTFGYGLADLRRLTLNAAEGAFLGSDDRARLIDTILPVWDRAVDARA